jgi:hypothetical protein
MVQGPGSASASAPTDWRGRDRQMGSATTVSVRSCDDVELGGARARPEPARVSACIERFTDWLDEYGETSWDHQSYYAGPIGRRAKALYYSHPGLGVPAVLPMVISEALIPAGRRLFWRRQRFPIADAHDAMGFAALSVLTGKGAHLDRARHFLEVLEGTRCQGYEHHGWGYPFDWVTRTGVMKSGTPLITTTPYVYEAFASVQALDPAAWQVDVMRSVAEHALRDIPDRVVSEDTSAAGYNPQDRQGCVVNASAYRAFLLFEAADRFASDEYARTAGRNLNFVLESQRPDGAWPYAIDGERDFVDHFHTCFVLKALAKIEQVTGDARCTRAIEAGVRYYTEHLFYEDGLPRPFSRAPRLTVYRSELYDYAECINLGVLLRGRFASLDGRVEAAVGDLLTRWQKRDGSFRSRKLIFGWDNVPMHRWAQAQLFRALVLYRYGSDHKAA